MAYNLLNLNNICGLGRFGSKSGAAVELSYNITVAAGATYTVGIAAVAGKTVTVDWGDEASTEVAYSTGNYENQNHIYTASGTYTIRISDAKYLKGFRHTATNAGTMTYLLSMFSRCASLTYCYLYGSSHGIGSLDQIPDRVQYLYPPATATSRVTGDIARDMPSAAEYVTLANSYCHGDVSRLPTLARQLYFQSGKALMWYRNTRSWTTILSQVHINPGTGFGMITEDIDRLLIDLNNVPSWIPSKLITLQGASEYRSGASDAAVTALTGKGVTVAVNGRHADGLYTIDSHGNRIITNSGPRITCLGDSLTNSASFTPAIRAALTGRTVLDGGFGGDTSTGILNRLKSHIIDPVEITPGVVRLKTKRIEPFRELTTGEWSTSIAEPRMVRFYNEDGDISTTYDRQYAPVYADGTTLLTARNHPFENGEQVYFRITAISGVNLNRAYYVRNKTIDTFSVSATPSGDLISVSAGMCHAFGGFYYDWTYTNQNANIECETYTDFDSDVLVIWPGQNNQVYPDVVNDITAMVAHMKAVNKRYVILTTLPRSTHIIGTAEYTAVQSIRTWVIANHPDNYIDTYSLLRARYNAGLPSDVTDYNNGIIPGSQRIDTVHLTADAYAYCGGLVASFITAKGW